MNRQISYLAVRFANIYKICKPCMHGMCHITYYHSSHHVYMLRFTIDCVVGNLKGASATMILLLLPRVYISSLIKLLEAKQLKARKYATYMYV